MDPATAFMLGKLIDAGLAITNALTKLGINYREVMDAQEAAEAQGRPDLNEAERQVFIDQAQSAVDQL